MYSVYIASIALKHHTKQICSIHSVGKFHWCGMAKACFFLGHVQGCHKHMQYIDVD